MSDIDKPDWGLMKRVASNRGKILLGIVMVALITFELFNYSTTQYALSGLIGSAAIWGMQWATILAIAFCGIDFAGIARVFTPEQGRNEPKEVWYLMGAWLIASALNAFLTYYAIRDAIAHNPSSATMDAQVVKIAPYILALGVWAIRILLIYVFSSYADKATGPAKVARQQPSVQQPKHPIYRPGPTSAPYRPPAQAPYSTKNGDER